MKNQPKAWMTHHDEPMLFPTEAEAQSYCDDEQPIPLNEAPVSAKMARVTDAWLDDHITADVKFTAYEMPGVYYSQGWRDAETHYQLASPVSAEPVGEIVLFGGDSDLKEVSWRKGSMPPPGIKLYTSPAATQPDLAQQTLDDLMAGIPARDAEIEALRKEIETLRAQQDTDRANALPPLNDGLIAILGRPNFMCAQLADTLRSGGHDIAERAENEQAAVIHFLLGHYLADPVQWAEKASAALKAARKENSNA